MLLLRGAGQVMGYKRRERAAGGGVCCSDGEGGWPTGAGLLAEEMKFRTCREQSAVTYRLATRRQPHRQVTRQKGPRQANLYGLCTSRLRRRVCIEFWIIGTRIAMSLEQ